MTIYESEIYDEHTSIFTQNQQKPYDAFQSRGKLEKSKVLNIFLAECLGKYCYFKLTPYKSHALINSILVVLKLFIRPPKYVSAIKPQVS